MSKTTDWLYCLVVTSARLQSFDPHYSSFKTRRATFNSHCLVVQVYVKSSNVHSPLIFYTTVY